MSHDRARELSQEPTAEPNVFVVTELSHFTGRGYYVNALVWKIEDGGRKCNLSEMLASNVRACVLQAPRFSAKVLAALTVPAEVLANVRAAALAAHKPGSL